MTKRQKRLIVLYEEMAKHTAPECAHTCAKPHSCCNSMYCEFTIKYAKEKWNVDLQTTDHPRLPLMGPSGCTAAPHLRPLCTIHTCDINSIGAKRGDDVWTKRYFKLRDDLEELESESLEDLVSSAP